MTDNTFGAEKPNIIRRALESVWLIPVLFAYAFFCWHYRLSILSVAGFSLFFVLILIFCKNIRNIYAPVLYIGFFIRDITGLNWTGYLICIAAVCTALLIFTIKTAVEKRGEFKRGKMFFALLVADAAFLLGGSLGRFDIMQTGIVFGFCAAVMILYLLAVNCTENFTDYLALLFIVGALFVSAEIMVTKINDGDLFSTNPMGETFFFSAHSLNTAAIFIMLGIAGCYYRGAGRKRDALYLLLSLFFTFAVFLSCCRTVLAVSLVLVAAVAIIMYIKSPRKKVYLGVVAALAAAAIIAAFFFTDHILKFIDMIIAKIRRGLNGRDELWPWCVRRFLEYPALGYGFIASETVPTVRVNLVLAHNTLLQWLTSTGIIGTSLMVYFYIRKYKAVFSGARSVAKTFIILAVICVELTGMMDQAAAMDIFVFSLPVLLLAGADTPVREMQAAPMPRAELSFGAV